jgi:biopolymer transport protein ExbB
MNPVAPVTNARIRESPYFCPASAELQARFWHSSAVTFILTDIWQTRCPLLPPPNLNDNRMVLDLYELFQRGGPVMWPLLVCSILSVAVSAERMILFWWQHYPYDRLTGEFHKAFERGGIDAARTWLGQTRGPLARVAEVYLEHESLPASLRQELVAKEASYRLTLLEKRLHWLSMIGSLAPMMGLLGTVWGLVEAFHQIELLGGQIQPGDLASGIWKALLTTVFGLVVALPTLAFYHLLEQYVGAIQLQMQWLITSLNQWLGHEPVAAEARLPAMQTPVQSEIVVGTRD